MFDHAGFVDQDDPIGFTQQGPQLALVNGHERRGFPRTLTHKMLQVAHVLTQLQGDPLGRFPSQVAQQAPQVHLAPPKLLDAAKCRLKQRPIRFQLGQALLHISLRQIELGRKATIGYNGRQHGFPSLSHSLVDRERYHAFPFFRLSYPVKCDIAL